jgi:hypothetical protein
MKTKVKKLPPVHLCLDPKDLRPYQYLVYVDKENVVATNSHIMCIYKTESILPELTDLSEPILIHYDTWKELSTKGYDSISLVESKKLQVVRNGETTVHNLCNDVRYPDWRVVLPTEKMNESVESIGFDCNLLSLLQKSLGCESVKLTFNGKSRAAVVKPICSGEDIGQYGIVMPVMITLA